MASNQTSSSQNNSTREPQKPALAGKKVIVVGAGISGLAFPLALRKQWPTEFDADFPSITIYERDTRETSPLREGYTISIRGDPLAGGMQALLKMGMLDELMDVSLTGRNYGQTGEDKGAFCLWDLNWNPLLRIAGAMPDKELPTPAMRIRRDSLRQVLIEAVYKVKNVTINWEAYCRKVETSTENSSGVKVYFSREGHDGADEVDECDLLIAADGSGSKIRAQVRPKDTLKFTGIVMVSGVSRFDDGAVPSPMNKNWGGALGGGGVGLFVSPIDSRSALWALSYRADKPRDRLRPPLPDHQVQSLLQEALDLGKPFSEPLPTLIRATDPATLAVMNAMDKPPFSHERGSSVVFIGDSNHAMSPFAGNGANMALCDAWQLAEQLTLSTNTDVAVEAYDGLSMPRSSRAINMSHWSISLLHATGLKLLAYRLVLAITRFIQRWKSSG